MSTVTFSVRVGVSWYSIYLPAAPSRWCIHCCQRCPLTYLGLNTTMTDRCQFVIECRRFWEYIVITLVCCFLGSLELWCCEWISLLLSHVLSANTEHVKMSSSSTVASAETAAAANITHLVGAGFMQSHSWSEGGLMEILWNILLIYH